MPDDSGTLVRTPSDAESHEAISALASDRPNATTQFARVFGGLVWSIARSYCTLPQDAEDAAQEALVRLWRSAKTYDPNRGTPAAFVIVVTRGAVLDYRKRVTRIRDRARGDAQVDPSVSGNASSTEHKGSDGRWASSDHSRAMSEALAALPVEQREAIILSIQSGLSHDEISRSLGVPLGTIKSRIRGGLLALRARLEPMVVALGSPSSRKGGSA